MSVDQYGNNRCNQCENFYSSHFPLCPHCCPHNELELTEEWHGGDNTGGWELAVVCTTCGRDFDFPREWLMLNFKLVRKEES